MKTLKVFNMGVYPARLHWTATFKSDESLLKEIAYYSERGYFCQVLDDRLRDEPAPTETKIKLFRLKSNPETIVMPISPILVQIVWSKSYEWGYCSSNIYQWVENNLIPLSYNEMQEIILRRASMNLPELA